MISFEHKTLKEFLKPFPSAHPFSSTLCQSQMYSQDYIIHRPPNPIAPPKPMLSSNLKKKNCMKSSTLYSNLTFWNSAKAKNAEGNVQVSLSREWRKSQLLTLLYFRKGALSIISFGFCVCLCQWSTDASWSWLADKDVPHLESLPGSE